jgi:transcription elongation factor Elf1
MSDPLTLGLASTAVSLVNGTLCLLKEARDSAKRSDDHDLKDKLSEVYDAVLELKECLGSLKDENADLLKRLHTRASLRWDTRLKLYFAENDPDPFCPTCMDQNGSQIRLHPDSIDGQLWRYECKSCKNYFTVNPRPRRAETVDRYNPFG